MFFRKSIISIFFTGPLFFIITVLVACAPVEYEVNLELATDKGGTVSGEGLYEENEEVTVRAEAEQGYVFTAWKEDGEKVSTDQSYQFTINNDRELVAEFERVYELSLEAEPEEGGNVTGEGIYRSGEEVEIEAEAEEGYSFEAWQRNGEEIGTEPDLILNIEEDTELTAHFIKNKEALNDYLETANEALNKGNWAKAGEYLEKASKIPGSEDTPIFAAIEDEEKPPFPHVNVIDILKNERIITEEQIKAGLEELEDLHPSEPGQDVLKKDPEALHNWLEALVKWRNELYNLPDPYPHEHGGIDEAIFESAGPKEIKLELGKFLKDPSGRGFFDFKLGEVEFSRAVAHGGLGLDEGSTFIMSDKPKLLDATVEQDSIVLTFELKEEMDHSKRATAGPGGYRVICDIYWKEDNTFRLGLSAWEPTVEKLD